MSTLYLTEQGAHVRKDGDTLIVHLPAKEKANLPKRKVRVPMLKLEQVVLFGNIQLTTRVITALLEQGVEVCYCTAHGRYLGRLNGPMSKNSFLRIAQHRAHHNPSRALALAKTFVWSKLANMRAMLLRAHRKRQEEALIQAAASIKTIMNQINALDPAQARVPHPSQPQKDSHYGALLGLEGAGSAQYFRVFAHLLKGNWHFHKRQRRPPKDPINALLSFGYTLLANQTASAVSIVGLDPFIGYLHGSQYGKPAMALDIMEPYRPLIVDSTVITLINNGMITPDDFTETLGAWQLSPKARRIFLEKFETRLNTEILHPAFGYKATYRRCLELEARLIGKWLMNEIPRYRPLVVR